MTSTAVATDAQNNRNGAAIKCIEAVNPYRAELVTTLIHGSCGVFPREALDPVGTLLHSILKTTPIAEAENICTQALQAEKFRLGDEAKRAALSVLGKTVQNTIAPSVVMDLLDDLWTLHQNDEVGVMVAGGDTILSFTERYG